MKLFSVPIGRVGFGYDLAFDSWNNGLAGYRVFEQGELEPLEGGLGFGLEMLLTFEGAEQWISEVPEGIYDSTSVYPEHQFQMLYLAANYSPAIDLLNSRPILLALICDKCSVDSAEAARLVRLGQRQILAELGLEHTKSALKFLDKVVKNERLCTSLSIVKSLLHPVEKRYQRFSHYRELSHSAVIIDHTYPFLTGTKLGMALASDRSNRDYSMSAYFADTLRLGEAIGIDDPISVIERLPSLDKLRELHDRWSDQRMQIRFELQQPKNTDVPYLNSFKLQENIEHIANYQQLCDEAKEQRHCISIYHNRLVSGNYLAFRLLSPERMTIGIKRISTKQFPFEIDQICGARNARPTEETRQIIYDWFESNRQSYQSTPFVETPNRVSNAN
ncbi:PcfJ domain-containing protein [Vibrio breoganii]